ncbi:putative holin [Pseudomonas sp. WHRI 8822A]|uniref:putative holin n=1 Tax=unclassified Pseudomonas TaxID=196821 RepID=UPI0017853B8B|nr:putative holin [Pseudomonas sp. PDM12]MBD9657501.1 hypothetical protein [Pseudomonas sp. PDM12]
MSDPASAAAFTVAGAAGAGLAGFLAGVDGNAATGALCGALVFVMARPDLGLIERWVYFVVSFVMGYLFSPALTELEFQGIRPFAYSGPAAFAAAALVVTVTVVAIKRRGPAPPATGEADG